MVEGDFIVKSQFDSILEKEPNDLFKLLYRVMWELGLRIGEVVGTSYIKWCYNCNAPIHAYKLKKKAKSKYCKCNKRKQKPGWFSNLRGIMWDDVDAVDPEAFGLPKDVHTVRIWGKKGHFDILDISEDLFTDIMIFLGGKVMPKGDKRIFPVSRVTVYNRLKSYGMTAGGKKVIHPHALRRGSGMHNVNVEKIPINEQQGLYRHRNLGQTVKYLDMGYKLAYQAYAQRKYGKHNNSK